MINSNDIVKVASYFKPISHTKGRLRVRVSSNIKELSNEINLSNIDELIKSIEGIKSVKFNKIIGSVTIEYDHLIFEKELWDNLLEGKNLDKITQRIDVLAKDLL